MNSSASNFIKNRNNQTSITNNRIKIILNYVLDCYGEIKKNKIIYDFSKRGKISQENFLRNGLVDDYLRKNIHLINNRTDEYTIITKESTETYKNVNDNLVHDDPIDIYITDRGLQNSWNSTSQVYFAIECKRITQIADTTKYVDDTRKFTERNYTSLRLPFEGQIAFVENSSLKNSDIVKSVNSKLRKHSSINTNKFLSKIKIHNSVEPTYHSEHKRNFNHKEQFSVYHLFFDYSNLVMN